MTKILPLWLLLGCLFALLLNSAHLNRVGQAFMPEVAEQLAVNNNSDLVHFWKVAKLSETQGPAAPYNRHLLNANDAQAEAFFYPPTALLALQPLAAVSFPALWKWHVVLGVLLYLGAVCFVSPLLCTRQLGCTALLTTALCFGGLTESLFYGQFGAHWAALWLLMFAAFNRAPQLAALPMTALSLKPHLGLALPIWLLWQRRWGLFLSTSLLVVLLGLLTVGLWGFAPWQGYLNVLHEITGRTAATDQLLNLNAPNSLYYGLRRMGATPLIAVVAQALLGLFAFVWLWRSRVPAGAQLALLPIVTLLSLPHWYPYDLAILILPLLALLPLLIVRNANWFDRILWLACLILPPLSDALNGITRIGPWPLVLLLLLWRGVRLFNGPAAAK